MARFVVAKQLSWMLISLVWGGITSGHEPDANAPSTTISFGKQIRPILQQHCLMCHGGVKNAGDLKLTDPLSAESVVVPGSPDESSLFERIVSRDDDVRMPPPEHGPSLSVEQIGVFRQWIEQGAKWDRHWAFDKPQNQSVPHLGKWSQWCHDPLDNWVSSRWNEMHELEPNPPSAPNQWLRKTTLALTGLPPTKESMDAFQKDLKFQPELAFENAVDAMLAAPTYGEHWATMWLDQVRYADSKGLGQDGPRTIWKYRDWVIDAFNKDMPYDQFTRMQLAGDLEHAGGIESSIATAVHRLTQTNEEGGTDDEEFRVAAVVDRVNTTWQVWQGATFGCVQCHDHPYDAYRHEDYYSFMAYFNNTADWDLDQEFPVVRAPLDSQRNAEVSAIDNAIREKNQTLWNADFQFLCNSQVWKPLSSMDVSSNATAVAIEPGVPNEFHTVGTVSRDTDFTIHWSSNESSTLAAIKLTLNGLDPDNALVHTEIGTVLSQVTLDWRADAESPWVNVEIDRLIADEPEPFLDPSASLDPKNTDGFGAFARIQRERKTALLLKSPMALPAGAQIRLILAHRKFVLDAFPLVSKRVAVYVCNDAEQVLALETDSRAILKRELSELRKKRAAIPSVTVPVLRELVPHLRRPTHVFIRGLFLTKDKEVQPGLPSSLLGNDVPQPQTRRELADWIVGNDNPLTARVHVNRIWARLFGRGIVVSEEDFGSSGDLPSNQGLLDELAFRFQHQYAWSQKRLLRDIVLSATFRQSSAADVESYRRDPDNQFLARGPRNRLAAEVIRDSALSVAGILSLSQGGPPAHPPIPSGVWLPFQSGDKWATPELGKSDRYRRSVYTYTKRSIPYPVLAAFDAPSREFCTARRMPSNTPVQALMALNDTTFLDAAQSIASSLMDKSQPAANDNIESKVVGLWEQVLGRAPDSSELKQSVAYFVKVQAERGEQVAWERMALLLLNHDEMFSN